MPVAERHVATVSPDDRHRYRDYDTAPYAAPYRDRDPRERTPPRRYRDDDWERERELHRDPRDYRREYMPRDYERDRQPYYADDRDREYDRYGRDERRRSMGHSRDRGERDRWADSREYPREREYGRDPRDYRERDTRDARRRDERSRSPAAGRAPARGLPPDNRRQQAAKSCTKKNHEQYLCDIWCNVEQTHVCLLCLRREPQHKQHKCIASQVAPPSMRTSVQDWQQRAHAQHEELRSVEKSVQDAIENLVQSTDTEVSRLEDTVEQLKARLDQQKNKLIEQARQQTRDEMDNLKSVQRDVEGMVKQLDGTISEVRKLNDTSSVAELVHLKKFISLTSVQKDKQVVKLNKVRFRVHNLVQDENSKLFDIGAAVEELELPALRNSSTGVIKDEVDVTAIDYSCYCAPEDRR